MSEQEKTKILLELLLYLAIWICISCGCDWKSVLLIAIVQVVMFICFGLPAYLICKKLSKEFDSTIAKIYKEAK